MKLSPSVGMGHEDGGMKMESEMVNHLRNLQNRLELPKPEMKGFNGDPLDFARFKMAFKTNVQSRTGNKAELYQNLRKYCTGVAGDAIKKYDMLPPDTAFEEATKELWLRFGQSHLITHEFHRKLQETNDIKPGERQELKKYADLLETVKISLGCLGKEAALDHAGYLVEVVGKLVMHDRRGWLRRTAKIREANEEVTFKDVVKYVKELSHQINDTEFAVLLENKRKPHDNTYKHDKKPSPGGLKAYFSSDKEDSTSKVKPEATTGKGKTQGKGTFASEKDKKCTCTGAPHRLWKCSEFKGKPYKQRFEIIRKRNLCFNCLNIDTKLEHFAAANCPQPKECKVTGCKASRKHHTLLHFDERPKNRDVESLCTEMDAAPSIYFPAFPVIVRSRVTGKEVRTWAGIDSYSSACFCDKSLLEELSLDQNEQPMMLNTLHGTKTGNSTVVELSVSSVEEENSLIELKEVYSWDKLPIGDKHIPSKEIWANYEHLKDLPISSAPKDRVRVLVGSNVPEAHKQLEWIAGPQHGDPVAVKYKWGWTLLGGIPYGVGNLSCNFVSVDSDYEDLDKKLVEMAEFEYVGTKYDFKKSMSAEDVIARGILEQGTYLCDGHYYVPIPLKQSFKSMPNNHELAYKRLQSVKKKLKTGKMVTEIKTEYQAYCDIFDEYHKKGYIRRIPEDEIQTEEVVNYIPFHHVLHPAKPGKLRLVWDAAARYKGSCLNDHIFSGEDNINSLLGVLLRFRTGGEIAIQADINAMFNQVFVPRDNWNLLRFLWYKDNDLDGEVEEFQLLHNFFGGTHAPGNAGYAVQRTCSDNADVYHPEVIKTGRRHMYVDDLIRSADRETARIIIQQIFKLMDDGGFVLAKFVTNDPELLQLVDVDRRAQSMQEIKLNHMADQSGEHNHRVLGDECDHERVLGVGWNIIEDTLIFITREKERPLSRRGLLGHIASLFDPEGAIAPVTLQPRQVLQKLTHQGLGWDDPLPPEDAAVVKKWLESLVELTRLRRPRYTVPKGFGKIVRRELHALSDGSETGYGYVLYVRYLSEDGKTHVSFLVGKALVTPKKTKTIPRIELQAALLSMRAIKFVVEEADVNWDEIYQWIDSTAVLAMLNNVSRRFLPYCANRLQEIRELQQEMKVQLRHVPGLQNIADICSRGLSVKKFLECEEYYNGPRFLWEPYSSWPVCPAISSLPVDHPELKREVTAMAIVKCVDPLMGLVEHYSSWTRLKLATAWLLRFKKWTQQTKCGKQKQLYTGPTGKMTVNEMLKAEVAIIIYVQQQVFKEETKQIGAIGPRMKHSELVKLHPQVDEDGSLRVGGRLTQSDLPYKEKHQLILPKNHHISWIIARHYHEIYQHAPPKTLLYMLRKRYWIINGARLTYQIELKCIICTKALARPKEQIQGVLPKGRVTVGNLWLQTGCDVLGPVLIKIGRSQVKRYVMGLVSFTIKAVHFEVLPDLTVETFLNAMRRFVSRRSRPEKLITDNAGTFSAGIRELNKLQEVFNASGVEDFMKAREIEWVPNVPKASNRNGLFERPFRALRRALLSVLQGQVTTEDQLATIVVECEHLYNSRPLCANSNSVNDLRQICPNDILNPEPAAAHPPGVFVERGIVLRSKYKQVQALISTFWKRFREEYLTSLQERTKSLTKIRDFKKGDLVMMCDEMWKLPARISCGCKQVGGRSTCQDSSHQDKERCISKTSEQDMSIGGIIG